MTDKIKEQAVEKIAKQFVATDYGKYGVIQRVYWNSKTDKIAFVHIPYEHARKHIGILDLNTKELISIKRSKRIKILSWVSGDRLLFEEQIGTTKHIYMSDAHGQNITQIFPFEKHQLVKHTNHD